MKNKTIYDLVVRLNEIHKELTTIGIEDIKLANKREKLIEEYDAIVLELWGHIPSLTDDVNIQPKKKVKRNAENGKKVQ